EPDELTLLGGDRDLLFGVQQRQAGLDAETVPVPRQFREPCGTKLPAVQRGFASVRRSLEDVRVRSDVGDIVGYIYDDGAAKRNDLVLDVPPEPRTVQDAAFGEVPFQGDVEILRLDWLEVRIAAGGGAVTDVGNVGDVRGVRIHLRERRQIERFGVTQARHQLIRDAPTQHQTRQDRIVLVRSRLSAWDIVDVRLGIQETKADAAVDEPPVCKLR